MIYRILITVFVAIGGIFIYSCKSSTGMGKNINSNTESSLSTNNNGVIIGKIKDILYQRDIHDSLSLCSVYPCTAVVSILEIVKIGPALLENINDSGMITLNFQMTLSPSKKIAKLHLNKSYPGLIKGDNFKGVIECYPGLSNSKSNCFVKDYIKLQL